MERTQIDPLDYAADIMKGLKKAALVTVNNDDRINTMTVAWGFLGIEWNKLIFNALIRESRHTHGMLDAVGEFSVNIPLYGKDAAADKTVAGIMGYCGSKSGRDTDKIADKDLTTVPGMNISAPGIMEAPLTLECRTLYRQDQDLSAIPDDLLDRFYPPFDSSPSGAARDFHTMYFGEVLGAYILG